MKNKRLITARAEDLVKRIERLDKEGTHIPTMEVNILADMAYSLALICDLLLAERERREREDVRLTDAGRCDESVHKDSKSDYTF